MMDTEERMMDAKERLLTSIYDRTDEIWYDTFAKLADGNGVAAARDMTKVLAESVREGHWRPSQIDIDAYIDRYDD